MKAKRSKLGTVPDGRVNVEGHEVSGGRLTVWINGREALPIRAIPYVTGWWLSPDQVAKNLARVIEPPFAKLQNLFAYHLQASMRLYRVNPREWDAVVASLEGFEAELRQQNSDVDIGDDRIGYAVWRRGAATKLPAGVFVWLGEFEVEYRADRGRVLLSEERPGDDEINLTPMMDIETRKAVLEWPLFTDVDERLGEESETAEADLPPKTSEGEPKSSKIKTNKLRKNILDPAITKAINEAGSIELAPVYLKLKELALNGEPPFTGEIEGNALCYTNDNNIPAKLTKDALSKRLKNRTA